MNGKIGLGVITCNRERLFKECISSLPEADEIIIVNDGKPYEMSYPPNITKVIQHKHNLGVGKSKNEALRYLMEKGCEHLFLMEDDVKIINKDALNIYIKTSQITGLKHLNFAYHGPRNKDANGAPAPRKNVQYEQGISVSLHENLVGAFSYYDRKIINDIGYFDERFKNAFEHIDHTLRIVNAGYYSPFFWFADVADSYKYILDLDPKLELSSIRKHMLLFRLRYKLLSYLFCFKHGHTLKKFPKVTGEETELILNKIYMSHKK